MRAARYYGKEDIRIETDVAEGECGEVQVRIAPAFVGICGTDIHEYFQPTFTPLKPRPLTGEIVPTTTGHEFLDIVTEVGKEVVSVRVGHHVVIQPTLHWGMCPACNAGEENIYHKRGFIDLGGGGGGLSGLVVVPERQL